MVHFRTVNDAWNTYNLCRTDGGPDTDQIIKYAKEKNMVKHVIIWNLKEDLEDKAAVKAGIKEGLEGLKGQIPGLMDIHVYTDGLASSNGDVILDSSFESEEALKG